MVAKWRPMETLPSLHGIYNYFGELDGEKIQGSAYFNGKTFFILTHTKCSGDPTTIKITHWRDEHGQCTAATKLLR